MAEKKKNNLGILEKNFTELKGRLERLVKGITEETEQKLLPKDTGDVLDDILGSLIRTYDKGENKGISEIVGKVGQDKLSDIIDAQFDMDRYKETILKNIMNASIDRIREQQYMIKNMPQINKVITSMTNAIMSPSTQSLDTNEITLKHEEVTANDVVELLKVKKFAEKERKCITNALSYGAGFMMIYPYRAMAENILNDANVAKKTGVVNPNNLIMASDVKNAMHTHLFGEANISEPENNTKDIPMSDIISCMSTLISENKSTDVESGIGLIKESLTKDTNYMESPKYVTDINKLVEDRFFTNVPVNKSFIHEFNSVLIGENYTMFEEAKRTVDTRKLKGIKGAYVKVLEEDKTIPVYINDELVGAYYVDYDTDFTDPVMANKKGGASRFSYKKLNRLNQLTTMGVTADVKEAITTTIKKQLDERFLSNNKHVMATIEKLVRDTKIDALEEYFMIRWIPKKYIIEYTNHDRQSQLANVEPLVLCWITLWRHYMLRKVFYEKDLRYVKFIVNDGDDDWNGHGTRALQAVKSMIPSPADIYNYRHMTLSISNGNKIAIPQTTAGVAPFELATIPGMKPDDNIFEELVKLASIITEEVGFNYNMLDPASSVETATQIIATREDKAELILNKQIQFNTAKMDAVNKICKYEWEHNDLMVNARFPELKTMKQNVFTDMQDKLNGKLDSIMTNMFLDETDEAKKAWIRSKLYRYYISTVIDVNYIDKLVESYDIEQVFKPATIAGNTGEE